MAREEHDREDLLGEATAFVERLELRSGAAPPVFIGFRRDGAASFHFGADPVFHFNAAGELRRALVAGLLYRADRGRLIRLRRKRTATETQLVASELSPDDSAALLADLRRRLRTLADTLEGGAAIVAGQVPADGAALERARTWLAACPAVLTVARRPHAI